MQGEKAKIGSWEEAMFTLIKGGSLYGPERAGLKDVLVVGRNIAKISDRIELPVDFKAKVISASGKIVTPGFKEASKKEKMLTC
jgi:dihydroorotase-like cyclic amidohydrolase